MKESYVESSASYSGPESCAVASKGAVEAWTGVNSGLPRVAATGKSEVGLLLLIRSVVAAVAPQCGGKRMQHSSKRMGQPRPRIVILAGPDPGTWGLAQAGLPELVCLQAQLLDEGAHHGGFGAHLPGELLRPDAQEDFEAEIPDQLV